MILASWNVNSLTVRLPHVVEWLSKYKPNVLCLQETKMIDEKFPKEVFDKLGYQYQFCGEKTYNGVAILSDRPMTNVRKSFCDLSEPQPARFIEAQVGFAYVINVYIPNGSFVGSDKYSYKLEWIEGLVKYFGRCHQPQECIVLCGDFNIAPDDRDVFDPAKVAGTIMVSEPERTSLNHVRDWGFIDSFRLYNHDGGHYTWWDYQQGAFRRNMGFRIDHIWLTNPLVQKCLRAWIDKDPRKWERPSDHVPIAIELSDS